MLKETVMTDRMLYRPDTGQLLIMCDSNEIY